MQKLALGALLVGLFACGGGNNNNNKVVDAPPGGGDGGSGGVDGGGSGTCDPVAQTGCSGTDSRCTWVQATAAVGYDGCVDAGTVPLGGACGSDAAVGSGYPYWDDCDAGNLCINGKCEAICSLSGGCGSGFFCQEYVGLFEIDGNTADGVCDAQCDPLTDNNFGSAGQPLGSGGTMACGSADGCYGEPSSDSTNPTHFTCAGAGVVTDVHRTNCLPSSSGASCAEDASDPYLNGCAPGYVPLLYDETGSTTIDCIAFCEPQDCYEGNCANGAQGSNPHACTPANVRLTSGYTFPSGSNAIYNQCVYLWWFEIDQTTEEIVDSPYDDYGFCYDDLKYPTQYGSGSNQVASIACSQLPGSGSDATYGLNAADNGCVSIETATALGDLGSGGSGGRRAPAHMNRRNRDFRFPSKSLAHRTTGGPLANN